MTSATQWAKMPEEEKKIENFKWLEKRRLFGLLCEARKISQAYYHQLKREILLEDPSLESMFRAIERQKVY